MYDKLNFYKHTLKFPHVHFCEWSIIKRWKFKRKLEKDILSELPRYYKKTGEKINWKFEYDISDTKQFNEYTGKIEINDFFLTTIHIYGYLYPSMYRRFLDDRYSYDICTGLMYLEIGSYNYFDCKMHYITLGDAVLDINSKEFTENV
jgi:hypothetical protein